MTHNRRTGHMIARVGLWFGMATALGTLPALGDDGGHTGGITAAETPAALSAFDIVHARITSDGNVLTFHMAVSGEAGISRPAATGALAGSGVFSYVWPTSMDSYVVGFDHDAGILALAVTSHPDFDDTPLFDENNDGDRANDGDLWHSHWVVLAPTETCGPGALGVVDIPEGASPRLPRTWPGLPLLLDSPGWDPTLVAETVEVRVPIDLPSDAGPVAFDGVTAGLRVNESAHAPLLCVTEVFDIASGDLSLPGRIDE